MRRRFAILLAVSVCLMLGVTVWHGLQRAQQSVRASTFCEVRRIDGGGLSVVARGLASTQGSSCDSKMPGPYNIHMMPVAWDESVFGRFDGIEPGLPEIDLGKSLLGARQLEQVRFFPNGKARPARMGAEKVPMYICDGSCVAAVYSNGYVVVVVWRMEDGGGDVGAVMAGAASFSERNKFSEGAE